MDSRNAIRARAEAWLAARARNAPRVSYPPELPITARAGEIVEALRSPRRRVIIVSGETGCGKSTQIPKMCLEAGRGIAGRVGVTQPRRLAAVTIGHRIAEELGEPLGRSVGYKIRFQDRTARDNYVKVMTDGILLAETQGDRGLYEYDTIIIDEAHERSLNIDFLLGIMRRLLDERPELKLVITSATLDTEKFSKAFKNAPVIEVSGRLYPVEVEYRVPDKEEAEDKDYVDQAVEAVEYLRREKPPGDILVFMPTEQDILETCRMLEGRKWPLVRVLPLFSRLPAGQQRLVYTVTMPKIVVATNVAETSLTIPGIRYVVDTGVARIAQYQPGTRINSLPISPISRASADQRKGRCGRVKAGLCVRLYGEIDYEGREEFTSPEILRSDLAEVILRMTDLGLGDPLAFPFIDRPASKAVHDGYDTLVELGAMKKGTQYQFPNYRWELTEKGRAMARMQLDPRLSRMLIEARAENCLPEVAVLAAALSIRDPRERPPDKAQQADAVHAAFRHPDSDFLVLLNIWNRFHSDFEKLESLVQKRRFCHENFLSFPRMREWTYLHAEIESVLRELAWTAGGERRLARAPGDTVNSHLHTDISPALYGAIHRSVLSGYLSNTPCTRTRTSSPAPRTARSHSGRALSFGGKGPPG
ncbi:MAG: ATP-dependent RNA helicase HrpA [Candidatus Aminicenantes bacterium RBG_16_66_30]|nr:MAG: ATP-dependent RNA helicase HrpA [Candidatus Aminicenantes bacterium RBG_16_66_30]